MEVATCELELPKLGITRGTDCTYRHFSLILSCDCVYMSVQQLADVIV